MSSDDYNPLAEMARAEIAEERSYRTPPGGEVRAMARRTRRATR